MLFILMALWIAHIEPEPVIYKQAVVVYNEPVSLGTTSADVLHAETQPTETSTSSERLDVSVYEPIECRCVEWLREVKKYNVKGDADTIQPNTDKPFSHGVVIQDYNGVRHVSGIKYILPNRILVEESNFEKCTPTERVIMLDSPNIVGFYFKNPN